MLKIAKIGSDPEVFLTGPNGLKSAIDLIPGTKEEPHQITDKGEFIQADNVSAEFNVVPSSTPEELFESINVCLQHIEMMTGLEVLISSSEHFPLGELLNPKAWEFGCDPDFSGWEEEMVAKNISRDTLRVCGGHVSVSFENFNEDEFDFNRFARLMDQELCVPLMEAGIETDTRRRQMYGHPAAYRHKPWGIEYRTLSNQWIKSIEGVEMVFKGTANAVEKYNNGEDASLSVKTIIETGVISIIKT